MKLALKSTLVVALALLALVAANRSIRAAEPAECRVMSFNILCDLASSPETNWEYRRGALLDTIQSSDPDLLGLQEAVAVELEFLSKELPGYKWFGVGRDDGKEKGEVMAIFYKADKFDLLDSGTFWLSETPDEPSKGWDAMCFRTVTWGKFKDKTNGKEFVYANTHLDHVGTTAREEGAKLILRRLRDAANGELPFFISGDFNVNDKSEAYRTITAGTDDIPGLRDANKVAKERDAAQEYTYHDMDRIAPEDGQIIDFIFVNDKADVLKFKINPVRHSSGRCPSDHSSIVATLSF
ncbi:MAG: endonuclease/exonuclease/phosphatase family protein [Thermoguttaceae bacterium]|nr:endonuclease/exonuclease/phosphatase family protein [Thermoguttaceae bacterium]